LILALQEIGKENVNNPLSLKIRECIAMIRNTFRTPQAGLGSSDGGNWYRVS